MLWLTHFLAKILCDELKDSIKVPKSHLNDNLDRKKKLEDLVVDDDYVLLSLDVSSLFTNVPCDLVLKSLDRRCQLIHNNCRIPFNEIINCTKFLFENTYFTFNNNVRPFSICSKASFKIIQKKFEKIFCQAKQTLNDHTKSCSQCRKIMGSDSSSYMHI